MEERAIKTARRIIRYRAVYREKGSDPLFPKQVYWLRHRNNEGLCIMKNVIKSFACLFALLPAITFAAARDVQIQSVNFLNGVVQVTNLGAASESLAGWRFCTHNTSATLRYSAATGLNGITLAPGESLYVHFNNDAAATGEINISTIGGNFAALERDAYGMGLYWQTPFGTGTNIADHLQWSLDGLDNPSADERSDEAVAGGVWQDDTQWIPTSDASLQIDLLDLSAGVLHSPADYAVEDAATIPVLPLPLFIALALVVGIIARSRLRRIR